MFKTYLRIAFRNAIRKPLYAIINMVGLSAGLAVAAITSLYLHHELSYDAFKGADSVHRISAKRNDSWFAAFPAVHSNYLIGHPLAEMSNLARVRRWPPKYLHYKGEQPYYERKVLFTDVNSSFFRLFDFPVAVGDLNNALANPNSAVITESLALSLFGSDKAVGNHLRFDTIDVLITAVIEDLPSNSNFDFRLLIANQQAMEQASAIYTFCQLAPGTDLAQLSSKILNTKTPSEDFSKLQDVKVLPLPDIHFEGDMVYELKPPGNRLYLVLFSVIGGSILLLSVFNFVNLSIAGYATRLKEIAIRKVVGARKRQVAIQFLVESAGNSLICLPFVLAIMQIILPPFNTFMNIAIENDYVTNPATFSLLVTIILLIGLLAGAYPAFILPRINALLAFKSQSFPAIGSINLRSILVGFQMTSMIIIVCGSWMITSQVNLLMNRDLGFEKEGLIRLKGAWSVDSLQYSRIKDRLLKHDGILSVANGFAPGDEDYGFAFRAEDSNTVHTDLIAFSADADYIETLGLEIIALRPGADLNITDKLVVINEKAAKLLGNGVGQTVVVNPGKDHESRRTVDGIIADFNFFSLHESVGPMMLTLRAHTKSINENILVKISTKHLTGGLDYISQVVREEAPNVPLTPQFVDDALSSLYQKEKQLSFFSSLLQIIAVVLSVIGVMGLSSYLATLKTKEIGIRKVLGATIIGLMYLVCKPFIRMSVVTFIIGACIATYLIDHWLASFAYRISIGWTVFAVAFLLLVFVLAFTVGLHALRAANADPVKSIKAD